MLTIVWDVDDVLNDLMYQWFHQGWLIEHPGCGLAFTDLAQNPPHEILGVERSEYLASMDEFRRTDRATGMTPNVEALAWFHEHGHRFRHIALTARPLETAPDVASWVLRHFGAWIRCFGVVPTRAIPGVPIYDSGKGSFLEWIAKGDVLVDDGDDNIREAAALGMKTLQIAQPWNKSQLNMESLLSQLSQFSGD
jgi:ribosomal protein L16/L10AE